MSRSLSIQQIDHGDDTLKMLLLFLKAGGNLDKMLKKLFISVNKQALYIMMRYDYDLSEYCEA